VGAAVGAAVAFVDGAAVALLPSPSPTMQHHSCTAPTNVQCLFSVPLQRQ
jgi:hypothetical protein